MNGLRLWFLIAVQSVKRAVGIEPAIPLLTPNEFSNRYIEPAVKAMAEDQGLYWPSESIQNAYRKGVASTE